MKKILTVLTAVVLLALVWAGGMVRGQVGPPDSTWNPEIRGSVVWGQPLSILWEWNSFPFPEGVEDGYLGGYLIYSNSGMMTPQWLEHYFLDDTVFVQSAEYTSSKNRYTGLEYGPYGGKYLREGQVYKIEVRPVYWGEEKKDWIYGPEKQGECQIPSSSDFHLQNYPNPFNSSTKISFELSVPSEVKLTIYNSLGQEVSELVNGWLPAGQHSVQWNAQNMPGGIYVYWLATKEGIKTKKMLLLK